MRETVFRMHALTVNIDKSQIELDIGHSAALDYLTAYSSGYLAAYADGMRLTHARSLESQGLRKEAIVAFNDLISDMREHVGGSKVVQGRVLEVQEELDRIIRTQATVGESTSIDGLPSLPSVPLLWWP
jgi:hypothetical protein